jgi:spermidine synthase
MTRPKKPNLVPVDTPWLDEPGVVRVLESTSPHDRAPVEGGYRHRLGQPFVLDQGGRRSLFFTFDAVQSSMALEAPDSLVSPYKRKMMAFLLVEPDPRHIVMLGLGGGSLAKFCHRHLPDTRLTVVEVNADVIALRNEFLVPEDDARFRVVHEDGAQYLQTTCDPIDVLLVDAFDAEGIAPSLATPQFYQDAAHRLGPAGVFVMNMSGDRSRYVATIKGARAAFGDRLLLLPVEGRGNLLLFGFKSGEPEPLLADIDARANDLEARLSLEFPWYLTRLRRAHVLRNPRRPKLQDA